ncbi:MAG: immunoglobulin domain-containing protein [Lacunisphaera sp.]
MNLHNLNSLVRAVVRINPLALVATSFRPLASASISRRVLSRTISFCVRSAFVLACGVATPFLTAANSWQWASPTPTGNHIVSFVYGGGQFVGVGNFGEIVTSPDGATWTARESGIYDPLNQVAYDGTRFVAVGGATNLTSTDGVVWTKLTPTATMGAIAAGNNRFVATTTNGFLTCTDGTNWTQINTSSSPGKICFTNGIFVAIDATGHALSSPDGLSWVTTPLPDNITGGLLVAGNGRFLLNVGATTYLSTDGISWRNVTAHVVISGIQDPVTVPKIDGAVAGGTLGFAGGFFYVQQSRYTIDGNHIYRSSDGVAWEEASAFSNPDFSTLASGGGVMVGTELLNVYAGANASSYAIHSSSDGVTWTNRSIYAAISDTSLVYGLGRFFAGGKVSSDAITWTSTPFEPTHAAGDLVFRVTSKFSYSDYIYFTVNPAAVTSVVVSADGLTGVPVDVKMPTPRSVAFGAGRYVFVGDNGNVSSSSDGLTWSAGTSGTSNSLQAVIFAFNRFVAVGGGGTLVTSTDGLTWSVQNTSTTIDFVSVTANSDRIVVGTLGSATSLPALTLSGNVTVQIATGVRSDALIWFDGEFDSAEFYTTSTQGTFAGVTNSTDGGSWAQVPLRLLFASTGRAMMTTGNNIALMAFPTGVDWTVGPTVTAVLQKRNGVTAAPVIAYAPAATTVHQGETATFSVGVTGSGPLSYQWNHNGSPLSGATSQVLSLPLVKDGDAGNYTVTVTNSLGSATSAAATLTVEAAVPLTITKQPVGGTLYADQVFSLSVEVSGSGPITYQWRKNGSPVSGGSSANYQLYPLSYSVDNYAGTYDVVVTAPTSTVTSQAVVVSRSGPVVSVSQSGSTGTGNTLIATATVTGKSPFTYVWGKAGGFVFAGATEATLVLPNVTAADNSAYSLNVTDADGLTTQAFFSVGAPIGDTAAADSQTTASAGQKLTLRVPIANFYPSTPTFQWLFNNAPISAATNWSYTTPPISAATAGNYSIVVSNSDGSTTTYTTTVTLGSATVAPPFVAQTTARTVATGATTTFSVSVGAAPASSYQWQVSSNSGSSWTTVTDSGPYSGSATSILSITGATATMNGYQYRCVAGSAAGNTTSNAATLSINNDPVLVYPVAIARDQSGNLLVADASANVIRMVTPTGAVSIFAGTVGNAGSTDGTGSAARFNQPGGLAFDAAGNLFVADTGNATIRKITPSGVVTTLAGDATARGNVDGTGNAARFNHPIGLAVDSAGNLFVADTFTDTVRKITPAGAVSTLAGTNTVTGSTDGSGAAARFNTPSGVTVDASGIVYVADTGNNTIRQITADGTVTTLAGLPGVGGSTDGTGSAAFFSQPTNLAIAPNGNLYVADTGNALIRRVTSSGVVTLVAGVPGISGLSDGVGLDALFDQPHGVVLDGNGNLLVADTGNAALRKIASDATVTTLALTAASTPAPVTTTSTTPTPPTSTSSSGGTSAPSSNSSGGGGAMAPWFGISILTLGAARLRLVHANKF